jgi:ubiquinone/menaquinone biosynthesis C-methylase UbiE
VASNAQLPGATRAPLQTTGTHWTSDDIGPEWVDGRDRMDRMLSPFGQRLLKAAQLEDGHAVLDVGCGTGSTTLAAWHRVAPTGAVTGIDLAPTMLAAARTRLDALAPSNRVNLIQADAGDHPFASASFDVVLSRFGAGHFPHPATAFSNLRRTLRPDGRLVFTEWADRTDNEWMTLVEDVALRVLGPLPGHHRPEHHPRFATPARLHATLRQAGFETTVTTVSERVYIGETVADVLDWFLGLPDAKFLALVSRNSSKRYLDVLAEELDRRRTNHGVHLGATALLIDATPTRRSTPP